MSDVKDKRRQAKKNLAEARALLLHMEQYINGKDPEAMELAYAFFHAFKYHLEIGDLKPSNVHLAALLRKKDG
jgi:hypothetical protein